MTKLNRISYAIPVCNEHMELKRLLGFLVKHKRDEDEIVVLCDKGNTTNEVLDLMYSLKRQYRKSASWLMNDSTIKAIRQLKDDNGQYLWQPALSAGDPDTIGGRPVFASYDMPEMATGNIAILFGDFRMGYIIADRGATSFQRLNELYAANGFVAFRAYRRVDGKTVLSEAIKKLTQKA